MEKQKSNITRRMVSIPASRELCILAGIRQMKVSTLLKTVVEEYMDSVGRKEIKQFAKDMNK